ncbi:chitobiase/beta-hexosaminidase C-terminal domain-containing protein [Paenibacillus sp. R14(2021)]|uniref:chitobiase/beta-hexosaminidase C-terminal domain-containing protein n=1 Tax=Paenibacillus sp. R14(2021) TaxID=2859228 RepID=UPI001C611FA9|nr:chitobiase/beta-hexosaminidase C-terminal domain-containing protein [Paenibacillus sp. R14(2021)]
MKKKLVCLAALGICAVLVPAPVLGDAVPPAYEIEVDSLVNWNQVYRHSDSLKLQNLSGDKLDPTRVKPSGVSGEYMVYRTQEKSFLRSFSIYAYSASGQQHSHPTLSISRDGKTYKEITPDIHESGENTLEYESRGFPGDTRYLKITFQGGGANPSPSIGKVVLNGPAIVDASVPSGTVPYGRMIMLNRGEAGETVYYTTDGSDPRSSLTRKHYSTPIPVLGKLTLKTTAVNHSGTGKSAASQVSTYQYETASSDAAPTGLIDNLDSFKLSDGRSNLYIAKNDPGFFNNDGSRATRTSSGSGYIVYRTEYDIHSFTVYSSFFTGVAIENQRFFASADGKQYTEIAARADTTGYSQSDWQAYSYEALALPAHTRYLKIMLAGAANSWSPQMSKVVINQNTASVKLSSSKTGAAAKAELSTETLGARIYYRLNKGPDFLPYTAPLELTGYNVLEAYAVKDGLVPSPIRNFSLNAGSEIEVDKYGQMKKASFTEKVSSDKQLADDASKDEAYYDSLKTPSDRDGYGGLAGSASTYGLKESGYFAIQQMDGRKVMTTPNGDLYFSLAVNGVTANETYTMVKGRELKFESVPPYEGEYKRAYIGKDNYSFYMANVYRKTGVFPTEHSVYSAAVSRLQKWGFNGVGNYSTEKYGEEGKMPYVRMLPLNRMGWAKLDGISIFDIFAPNAEAKIDATFQKALTPHKDDRMLIGYFIDNEYDFHKFYSNVPKLKASSAAIKGKLVERMLDKYETIAAFNAAWGTKFESFDDLGEADMPVKTSASWRDMDDFYAYYLDTFFGTVSRIYRKYDPNHLLLGDRWITTTFHNKKFRDPLAETEGKYVDVISINYYSYKIETDLLQDVYEKSGGKPILLSEFGYGTGEQGLKPLLPNSASNQFQRGMRYRNYVEGVATLPYIVGAHLFNYVDQAGLGRYWQGEWGEHYNSGLVNVADRPYKDYLKGIKDTNDDIYKLVLKERPKFYYDFNKG